MSKKVKTLLVAGMIIIIGIVLDQITKAVFERLENMGSLPIRLFGTSIGFEWRINYGAAWSILADKPYKNLVFFLLTIIGLPIFGILLFIGRQKSWFGVVGYAGIISGAIGNAIDRGLRGEEFFSGGVRDFITVGDWFPVFNVADSLLVCGAICVFLALLFFDDDAILRDVFHKKSVTEQGDDEGKQE